VTIVPGPFFSRSQVDKLHSEKRCHIESSPPLDMDMLDSSRRNGLEDIVVK